MKETLYKIYLILDKEVRKTPYLIVLFIILSIMDVVGLSIVAPYISLLATDDVGELGDFGQYFNVFFGNSEYRLHLLSLFIVIVFFVKTIVAIFVNNLIIKFSQEQNVRVISLLMNSYQFMPYSLFTTRNTSEYIYSIQTLSAKYSELVLFTLRTISDVIVISAIFLLLASFDLVLLFLLLFVISILIFLYYTFIKEKLKTYGRDSNKFATLTIKGVNESMSGFKEVRTLGLERFYYKSVIKNARSYASIINKVQLISLIPRFILEFLLVFFVATSVMATLLFKEDVSDLVPTLALFSIAAIRVMPAVNNIVSLVSRLKNNMDAVDRLYSDIGTVISNKQNIENRTISSNFKSLEFKSVYFSYNKGSKVCDLSDISIKVNSGDVIGIIGKSGSGKTTLIDLMLGLLNKDKGVILYNNKKTDDLHLHLKGRVAYIPQDVHMIDSTLCSNIAIGVEESNIDYQLIDNVINLAKLRKLVDGLPNGIYTKVGENGIMISGGQKQRIALARAFYHKRDVMVMDESTSALDSETESEIVNEIRELKGKKTIVIIAHKKSILRHCDRIYELKNGNIFDVTQGIKC